MKFGSLFTGGGMVDIAAETLGYTAVFGVEHGVKIAAVARQNGLPVQTADALKCSPADFQYVDWLHASPPCPNFSVAKVGAMETANDFALARKVAGFITVIHPRIFTLENVYQYRLSDSFKMILKALNRGGYNATWKHINFADYGIPQTRRRLVLIARRDGEAASFAPITNQRRGDWFTPPWNGWYSAIEDLIPTLATAYHKKGRVCEHDPDGRECRKSPFCRGHFADWQMKRLPSVYKEALMVEVANGSGGTDRWGSQPAATILAGGGGRIYRAFIVSQGSYGDYLPTYDRSEPVGTITANSNQGQIKAASNGRVVVMSVRALARFQSIPDWYTGLTTRIVGNAVPPRGMARACEGLRA